MSCFPRLLLLVLGLHVTQVQGSFSEKSCFQRIYEIRNNLKNSTLPSPPPNKVDDMDKWTLWEPTLRRPNMDVFLNMTTKFPGESSHIKGNLKELWQQLPNLTSTKQPIYIHDDWDDFRKKLEIYLQGFCSFLNAKR